jgi:hypothetical protein
LQRKKPKGRLLPWQHLQWKQPLPWPPLKQVLSLQQAQKLEPSQVFNPLPLNKRWINYLSIRS